jgi:hypothetical protein
MFKIMGCDGVLLDINVPEFSVSRVKTAGCMRARRVFSLVLVHNTVYTSSRGILALDTGSRVELSVLGYYTQDGNVGLVLLLLSYSALCIVFCFFFVLA